MNGPTSDHDELQLELPAFADGRLGDAARARMEAHLTVCEECRDLAATFRELGAAVREGGELLFAPHPAEADLRRYAQARGRSQDQRTRQHLEACVTCALEVDAWKRRRPPASGDRRPTWGMVALASAAGLLVGFLLALLLTGAPFSKGAGPAGPAGLAIGPQLILPSTLRAAPGRMTYRPDPGQQSVVVAWPAVIPNDASADARFRFEIGPPGAGASWSQELTAAEIRRHLEAADRVTLVVPAAVLSPGLQEARILRTGAPDQLPVYLADIDVIVPGATPR